MDDDRSDYRTFVNSLTPSYLPGAQVKSGRSLRFEKFKRQLRSTGEQAKFG